MQSYIETNPNPTDLKMFLNVLQSELDDKVDNKSKFRVLEANYGFELHGKLKIDKSCYMINLFDIIESFLKNDEIKSMLFDNYQCPHGERLESFFDGQYYKDNFQCSDKKIIFLALYADEINLVNPIGTIFYSVFYKI